ncbi:MAG: HAMP domain-containing protein [Planctomycetales bacterium]|nr:HAMP domain-containing protein [Planctomycetales bacterium]
MGRLAGSASFHGEAQGLSLFIRVALFVFVTTATTVAALTGISYYAARWIIHQQVEQRLYLAATQRAHAIELYVAQQHERVEFIARGTRLRRQLRAWTHDELPTETFRNEVTQILADSRGSTGELREVMVADRSGVLVAGTSSEHLGRDMSLDPAFEQGQNSVFLSEFRDVDGLFLTTVAAPIHDDDGELLGVILVTLHASRLIDILADPTGLGLTGEVLIGRFENEDLIHYLLPSRLGNLTEIRASEAVPMAKAIRGLHGHEYAKYHGQPSMVVFQPVNYQPAYRPWGVVVRIATQEAFTPLYNLRRIIMPLGLLLLIPSILSAYWLASRYARPIMRLAEAASIFASGNLKHRVVVADHGEIGALSVALNEMAEQLEASYEVLEKRVAERTEELERTNSELARSNRDLEQFAYVASHDIQEPLRAITGFAKLLRDQRATPLNETEQEYLGFILSSSERLKLLIDNLLEYSRLRTQAKDPQQIDSRAALDNACANLRSVIEQRNAVISTRGLGAVTADPLQLTQLFQNLIGNALKFCDRPQPVIQVAADYGPEEVIFSIRDNGIGLDAKDYQRIFTIFSRLHGREEYSGTGLGLAICQQIVQRHGGRIWVESKVGEGSTFYFTLPRGESQA